MATNKTEPSIQRLNKESINKRSSQEAYGKSGGDAEINNYDGRITWLDNY